MKILLINSCLDCPYLTTGGVAFECSRIGDNLEFDAHEILIRSSCPLIDVEDYETTTN